MVMAAPAAAVVLINSLRDFILVGYGSKISSLKFNSKEKGFPMWKAFFNWLNSDYCSGPFFTVIFAKATSLVILPEEKSLSAEFFIDNSSVDGIPHLLHCVRLISMIKFSSPFKLLIVRPYSRMSSLIF